MSDTQYPRRVGRGMIFLASITVLGMLTLFFEDRLSAQRNPNRDVESSHIGDIRQVVLDANRQDHYVATARINGQPVEVLVDTGATQVAVAEPVARRLGLPFGARAMVGTANGTARVYLTTIDEISLGDIVVRGVEAAIIPNMGAPEVLLGMNFLRDLEMTHRDGRLVLKQY